MKKALLIFTSLACLAACCQCPSETQETKKAKAIANDFKTILSQQEEFIVKNGKCASKIEELNKSLNSKYKEQIVVDQICNVMLKTDDLMLRAFFSQPEKTYNNLLVCGKNALAVTGEGFVRYCGPVNIGIPQRAPAAAPKAPKAPVKK